MKILPAPAIGSAISGALTAARASKIGQTLGKVGAQGKKLAAGVKTAQESPMGQAWGHLQNSSANNQAANQQMEAESRQLARGGAGVGSTTMGN